VRVDPDAYQLIGSGTNTKQIIPKSNGPITVEKKTMKGYFKVVTSEISVFVKGWAVNMESPGSILKLLVFIDNDFCGEGTVQFHRKDVVRVHKNEAFLISGFSFNLPRIKPNHIEGMDIQVFAYDEITRKASRLLEISAKE